MRRFCAILLAAVAGTSAVQAEDLVVYSGRSDKFVRPVMEEFTKRTGIDVVLHNAESTALLNKLRLEGARTDADLYLSNDAGNLERGAEMGLFQSIAADIATAVPERFRGDDNQWLGLSARARVLVANEHSALAGQADSVFDLARPEFRGHVGITTSANESFVAGVTVYMEEAGRQRTREWLEGLKRNAEGRVFNKHSKIVKAVASGDLDVGLVNHYYIYRHLANEPDAPIRIVLPDQGPGRMGIAWNVAGVAISKHTDDPQSALKLVEFLVSEAGQQIFAEQNREYPTRPGVPAAAAVPPAGSFKVADVPMVQLGRKRAETIDLIEEVGLP